MKLADPVTVKMLLGWAAGVVVAVFAVSVTCGSSVVTRAEAAAAAQVSPVERRVSDIEKRIDARLERMESKLDRALEKR